MSQCKACLLEVKAHGIGLDDSGICSYCRIYSSSPQLTEEVGCHPELFSERLERFRGTGKYDCLAGLSGGKDSSYVLYRLIRHYGARTLAFTFENGFLNDYGRANIDRMIRDLGVEHVWVRPSAEVHNALYQKSLRYDGWPCTACFYMFEATMWKLAVDKRIPFIVTGRAPEQMFRTPKSEGFDPSSDWIGDNLAPYDPERVANMANRYATRISTNGRWLLGDEGLLDSALAYLYYTEEASPFGRHFAPELLSLFLYEKHNVPEMMDLLQRETSWQAPPPAQRGDLGHADCMGHDAAGYLFNWLRGAPFAGLEVAHLIRQGKISRAEGEKLLREEAEKSSQYPKDSMAALSKASGWSEKKIMRVMRWRKFKTAVRRFI